VTHGSIAVVITCRDLGRLALEAIDSVERQTRSAAEILVVDDGSTDVYTRQILSGAQRNGTRVAAGPGRGVSAARNLGARLTSSDYLVFLDADDVLDTTYLAVTAARLDADAQVSYVSSALRAFGAASYTWTPSAPDFVSAVSTGGVPHASTMMRRSLWEAVGGFDERVPSYELLDFWASVIERGFRGVILDEPLLNYRVRPGSGYHRSIQSTTYRSRLEYFYAKHRSAIERHGLELVKAKEAFLQSQREHQRALESRTASLEAEIGGLRQRIAEVTLALEARGSARVQWADLHRIEPFSHQWGRDRGTAVDRHYIERFLERHRTDIRGRVLEVRDSTYTQRFGGSAVTAVDVVDIDPANNLATVTADLRRADGIASGTYDCIVLTQTLQFVDDMTAVLGECARILRPGGVLLVTAPSVTRVDDEGGVEGDFWRLTEAAARKLFADVFPVDAFEVTAYGNVLACAAFLYGLSLEEMSTADLNHHDSNFPVVIAVRAVKPALADSRPYGKTAFGRTSTAKAAILAYHRIAALVPDTHGLSTPPDRFREHMAYLRREFEPIALADLVRAAASGTLPERAVAVTFDDGYLDALAVASPILIQTEVPATFFVNTERIGELRERWWDVLERVFATETLPTVLEVFSDYAGFGSARTGPPEGRSRISISTRTPHERASALTTLNQMAWPLDAEAREKLVGDVLAWSGIDARPRDSHRLLTDREICALADRPGHTIGAHTTHHLALTAQTADTKRKEILESKATLERVVHQPVELFAYPYGEFDGEIVSIVKDAGFRAAVTVQPGLVAGGTNRLLLPRQEITPADHHRFPNRMREIFEGSYVSIET
jgi:peptidoglycan/xylan/chitin deacetylase (PgdA/CDA1 family)